MCLIIYARWVSIVQRCHTHLHDIYANLHEMHAKPPIQLQCFPRQFRSTHATLLYIFLNIFHTTPVYKCFRISYIHDTWSSSPLPFETHGYTYLLRLRHIALYIQNHIYMYM